MDKEIKTRDKIMEDSPAPQSSFALRYYNSGVNLPPDHPPFKRSSPKIQRNEKCPCGSGLKFKKCCSEKEK